MKKMIQCPLDGWEIVREISSGSYGRVYEIKKLDNFGETDHSALKVISIPESGNEVNSYRDDGLDDESIMKILTNRVKDIREEFSLMSKLRGNSNIVSYEDHETIQHKDRMGYDILIRMELLTSLTDYVNKTIDVRKIDDDTVIRLGVDICRALELCRKHDIIHRDIKPQNIFINKNGDFKLGDFGIAKTMDHSTYATKAGTYGYMAPEVYKVQPYNASIDMYSLGLVMYWILNERRGPFLPLPPEAPKLEQNKAALDRRMNGDALPRPRHGGGRLTDIVLKACAYDARDRFATPTQMRLALEDSDKTFYIPPGAAASGQKDVKAGGGKTGTADADKNDDGGKTETVPGDENDGDSGKTETVPANKNGGGSGGKKEADNLTVAVRHMDTEGKAEPAEKTSAKNNVVSNLLSNIRGNKKTAVIAGSAAAAVLLIVVLSVVLGGGKTKGGEPAASVTPAPAEDEAVLSDWDSDFPVDDYLAGEQIDMLRQYRSAQLEVSNKEKNDGSRLCYVEKKVVEDWSDWQEEEPEGGDSVEIETRTVYQYRTLHGSRVGVNYQTVTRTQYWWGEWEESTEPVEASASTQVQEITQYRYRVLEDEYYYAVGDWSDFSEESVAADDAHIVNMSMFFKTSESDETHVSSIDNFNLVSFGDTQIVDISPEDWYYNSVNSVVKAGILCEDEFLRFLPKSSATVGEIVRAAVVVNRIYNGEYGTVPLGAELYYLVENDAMDRGIINAGEFPNMNASITRLEAATVIYRALPVKELVTVNEIADIIDMDKNSDAYRAVYQLAQAGVIAISDSSATFSPENSISRAEAASLFDRLTHPDRRYVR